jgi:hypothetical protein
MKPDPNAVLEAKVIRDLAHAMNVYWNKHNRWFFQDKLREVSDDESKEAKK